MNEFVLILILVASITYMSQPLLRKRRQGPPARGSSNGQLGELTARKESLISAIKELEFDYEMGKLSEEDFRELNDRYRAEALEVMERLARRGDSKTSIELEIEIRKRRKRGTPQTVCPNCAGPVRETYRYCTHCGTPIH